LAYGFFVDGDFFLRTFKYMDTMLLLPSLSLYYAPEKMLFVFSVKTGDEDVDRMIKKRHRGFPGKAMMG
jgi:hypothetical protein